MADKPLAIDWNRRADLSPEYPFRRNHCSVVAMAALGGKRSKNDVWYLARDARDHGLIDSRGTAWGMLREENMQVWAQIAGVAWKGPRITTRQRTAFRWRMDADGGMRREQVRWARKDLKPGEDFRMSVATFCRTHPTGKWLVDVSRHVLAVIDGIPLGYWKHGMKVLSYREAE